MNSNELTPIRNGRKFVYPEKWCSFAIKDDIRVSENRTVPTDKLPVFKPDFSNDNVVSATWFGHSSLMIHMHGMNILIDPVFSKRASPLSWIGPQRFTTPSVKISQLPKIDIVLITHDHYDHLDFATIKQLDSRVKRYLVPLGVEKHLKRWNISNKKIIPLSWWNSRNIGGLEITCTPTRHFSGRGLFSQNSTLWCSWVLKDDKYKSGDGSFGGHFKAIHDIFGDFDFAFMECGQYSKNWHSSHLYPEESAIAAKILGANNVIPIHWGAFVLSNHAWDDSPERFVRKAEHLGLNVITPHLCETITLENTDSYCVKWWRKPT